MTVQERFWQKVEKTPTCWLWTAYKNACGYGVFGLDSKPHLAHRVAWELSFGRILPGVCVLHTCHTPACVRPSHLYLGMPADNAKDRTTAGRGKNPVHPGIQHPLAKLTEQEVRQIRASNESLRVLALRFGVSRDTVSKIRLRRLWKHVQ